MFRGIKPTTTKKQMVDAVLKGLSSVDTFKVHGRMINGTSAKNDLKLEVKLLGKTDEFWKDLWQYYVRAEMMLSRLPGSSKLIETKNEILVLTKTQRQ